MREGLYVIFDRVAEISGPVVQAVNDGVARRYAINAIKTVPDYDRDAFVLYRVADIDTTTMEVTPSKPVEISFDIPKIEELAEKAIGFPGGLDGEC